jgi:hypothetical protein
LRATRSFKSLDGASTRRFTKAVTSITISPV